MLGSYATGGAFVLGLIALQRRRLSLRVDRGLLRRLFRFGLPTMPAEVSLYLLNFVDRLIIVRTVGLAEAGLYSLAVKFAQAVNVLVRGFQLAWPPLAYSIRDDEEARRAYATIVTLFAAGCAFVVTGMWLFSRWIVRALAAPKFFDSFEAIGLVSTAVTLYALYLVLVVILGRTGPPSSTSRRRSPPSSPTSSSTCCWCRRWRSSAPASPSSPPTWWCWG